MPPEIVIVSDLAALHHAVAARMAKSIAAAIAQRQWCFLGLPGGPFVRPIYAELSQFQLPWSEVEFYFTDERCVPPEHPASNYGEAIDKFLKNPRIGLHQFHRIEAERADRDEAAERYAEELPEQLDLLLVELGADGHLGALFPGSPALDERERVATPVEAPNKPRWRITLTPAAIRAAREVFVVATGREKAGAVERALRGAPDIRAHPGQLARGGVWFLDRPAASLLDGSDPASVPPPIRRN
jgi:6-phosphogluconolactonase